MVSAVPLKAPFKDEKVFVTGETIGVLLATLVIATIISVVLPIGVITSVDLLAGWGEDFSGVD